MSERRGPTYIFSDQQVSEKNGIARRFLDTRTRLNENVDKADNFLVKRFYNLDHNTYLEGALPAKYKELMGLVASASLRCDDCITTTSFSRTGWGARAPSRKKQSMSRSWSAGAS